MPRKNAAWIARQRPAMVIVDRFYDEDAPGGDVLAWMMAEPRFRAALAGYREIAPVAVLRRFVPVAGGGTEACVPADLTALTTALPK